MEISPALRKKQWTTLKCVLSPSDVVSAAHCDAATQPPASDSGMSAMAQRPVTWHASLDAVPGTDATAATVPTLYLAHEFFDALPVHQFVRDPARGWLEKMVDVQDVHDDDGAAAPPRLLTPHGQPAPRASEDAANGGDLHLRMVLSPRSTPATAMLVPRRLRALGEPGDGLSAIEARGNAGARAFRDSCTCTYVTIAHLRGQPDRSAVAVWDSAAFDHRSTGLGRHQAGLLHVAGLRPAAGPAHSICAFYLLPRRSARTPWPPLSSWQFVSPSTVVAL